MNTNVCFRVLRCRQTLQNPHSSRLNENETVESGLFLLTMSGGFREALKTASENNVKKKSKYES
jgi:hypothetical protein